MAGQDKPSLKSVLRKPVNGLVVVGGVAGIVTRGGLTTKGLLTSCISVNGKMGGCTSTRSR